jgi:ATP-binding cassette subfamily F protein uup
VDSFGHLAPYHGRTTPLALAGIRYHLGDQTILDGVELRHRARRAAEPWSAATAPANRPLLKILAGEPIADAGTRFAQPGATVASPAAGAGLHRPCQRSPTMSPPAFPTRWGPSDYRVAALLST